MKYLTKEQIFIKNALIEKADEINNIIDCDVIQETRNELYKTLYNTELKENAIALYNAIIYKVDSQKDICRYMLSIIKEI